MAYDNKMIVKTRFCIKLSIFKRLTYYIAKFYTKTFRGLKKIIYIYV